MIFTPGIAVGALSGSVGGTTASRNKGGPYFRVRGIPTDPRTAAQLARRAALASESARWQLLTTAQRDAWDEYGRQNPSHNALGSSILISGHGNFVGLNTRILLDAGAAIDVPPITPANDAFLTMTQQTDIGTGAFTLTFTDALESGSKVELWGALLNSPGVNNVESQLKFIAFSAVDEPSPWNNVAEVIAALGTVTAGQTLHIRAATYVPATGQRSPFLRDRGLVIDTP